MISVGMIRPEEARALPWTDLAPFARNAFMNPVALKAAADTMLATIYILVAWETAVEPARLVGVWALQAKSLMLWPVLEALPFNYAFLSTPVLHPDHADDIVPAFLAMIAADKRLPDVVVARDLDMSGREHSTLDAVLGAHPMTIVRETQRPIATRENGVKRSGSSRKKLRQTWNKLAGEGELAIENVRDPARIGAAFEAFLTLEAAGWKGKGGTALLNNSKDAAFARRLVADLAAQAQASVALLTLDGRPIATQVLIYSGRIAYTWKTSFDPALARFSPGSLLIDRLAGDLIDDGEIDLIDSCSQASGFMGQLLTGRKPMADLVFSASKRPTLGFRAVSFYLTLRESVKQWRNRLQQRPVSGKAPTPPRPPATAAPVPRGVSSPVPRVDRAA